jgi:diguanylate cyclase (GGDEF)-like protein
VSRALRTLSAGNSAMLRARDEVQLLDSMCKAIVDAGGYPIAMVWYRQDDEARSTRVMAESGYAPGIGLLRRLKTSWKEGPHGGGAVAKAIRTGQTQVVPDMLTEPGYAQWREHLLGNASCIACPLHVNGEVIGALAIFAREPQAFGADEVRLLGESADDLAFGIASLRTRRMEEEARQQAYRLTHFDALTGLANGTRFVELINSAIETHAGTGTSFALLQTNIERLSEINDTLGFSQGDQMLQEFGTRLRATVSDASAIARLRGDEFAVLLAQSGREAASAMVHRLEDMLRKPFPLGDIQLDLSAKTGIVLFPEHGHTVHDLLRNMDVAVRQTKALGHNHAIYDPDTQQDRPQRLNMAGELRQAIEGGELLLYLQPKVEMASGRVLGSEALVRWQHPTRGLVPPMHFIELAEHTGLIKPLTDWVIEAAMRLIKDWQGQPHGLPIAVNLSAKNLQDEGMLSRLRLLQTGWGIPPGMLEAEITETAIMGDTRLALRVMNQLRDDGVRLYIDDFGTGYSSLAYLQKLPVHCIKIDQSFVRDIAHNKDSALIVKSTIDLAHDLGRKAVAEGIETQADWDVLEKFGCDVAQGYFIARPMPSEQFPQWFAAYGAKGPLAPQDLW